MAPPSPPAWHFVHPHEGNAEDGRLLVSLELVTGEWRINPSFLKRTFLFPKDGGASFPGPELGS